MTREDIRQVVATEFTLFEQAYHRLTDSPVQLIREVNDYVDRRSGKRMRPLLLLLSAGGRDSERAAMLAAAMEILHSASLMHDDVVDMSLERRGQDSVNGHWGNQIAVLCGDYYLSCVMRVMNEFDDKRATHIVNETVKTMCEGELLQQQYLMEHRFDSSRYMDIIYRKTGALMTACCELGDASLRQYGVCFGTAFQVRDDLMDYGTDDTAMLPAKDVLESELQRLVNEAVGCLGKQPATKYTEALRHLALNLLDTSC